MIKRLTESIELGGYSINEYNHNYRALSLDKSHAIIFSACGSNGYLKCFPKLLENRDTGRYYRSTRYLRKYTLLVKSFGKYLMDNGYLWDYGQNKPLLDTKKERF